MAGQLISLAIVEVAASGVGGTTDEVVVGLDGAAEITFHHLHMVAVIEEAEGRRAHATHHLGAEGCAVALDGRDDRPCC